MSSALARKYALQVATYIDGTLPTSGTIAWLPFLGVNDFNDTVDGTFEDVSDFDTDGFASTEKTMQTWGVQVKARRPIVASVYDPGQEVVRLARLQFGPAARVFARYFDRNGGPEAYAGVAMPNWTKSKTGTANIEEIQVALNGDGKLFPITNPYQAAAAPTLANVAPAGKGAGQSVTITGSGFTGTTSVKFGGTYQPANGGTPASVSGGTPATDFSVISDGLIIAVLPAGSAGATTVNVTNANGASQSLSYTRAV